MHQNKIKIKQQMLNHFRDSIVTTLMFPCSWTEERAVKYLEENTALSKEGCVAQIRRYIRWPGQACAYKIGQLVLIGIRQKAERVLGRSPIQWCLTGCQSR